MSVALRSTTPPFISKLGTKVRMVLLAGVLLPLSISCGDDGTSPDENTVVGIWDALTFSALGTDLIADGMSLTVSLGEGESYTFAFRNDLVGACEPGPNCTQAGTYELTGTNLSFDPFEGDPFSFAFSFQNSGSGMTWTGMIDGNPVTVTLEK